MPVVDRFLEVRVIQTSCESLPSRGQRSVVSSFSKQITYAFGSGEFAEFGYPLDTREL